VDGLGSVGRSAPGSYGPEAGSIVEASDLAFFSSSVGFSFGRRDRFCGAENSVVLDGKVVLFLSGGYLNSG